jgi:hypothetical protein
MPLPIRGSSLGADRAADGATDGATALSFGALKERQLVFLLARQLAEAQFVRGDRLASERLWQEVAALEIDPDRIIALLYEAPDLADWDAMERIDRDHRCSTAPRGLGWFGRLAGPEVRNRSRGAWHRTSPRATPPARRAVR